MEIAHDLVHRMPRTKADPQTSRTLGPDLVTSPWLRIPDAMFQGTTGNRSRAGELLEAIVDEGQGGDMAAVAFAGVERSAVAGARDPAEREVPMPSLRQLIVSLAAVAAKAGLWFFHDDTCQYCESQVPIANAVFPVYLAEISDSVRTLKQHALTLARARGVMPQLVIAGSGPEHDRLQALARQLGVDNVEFIGFVDDPGALLAGLHGYVQPSRNEGLCLAAHGTHRIEHGKSEACARATQQGPA